jgi:hypothetical protein
MNTFKLKKKKDIKVGTITPNDQNKDTLLTTENYTRRGQQIWTPQNENNAERRESVHSQTNTF